MGKHYYKDVGQPMSLIDMVYGSFASDFIE